MPTAEAPVSRRERKKTATRDAIHHAALSLVEELGLAGATLEAITERADVSSRTFFNHFPSKLHAVLGRDPDLGERVRQALESRPAGEAPLVALRHVLVSDFLLPADVTAEQLLRRLRVLRSDPALVATMHAMMGETERGMVAVIAQRTGLAETDLYPSLVVSVAVSAARVGLMRWCEQGGQGPVEDAVLEAFDHLADGLAPPPAPSSPT